MKTSIELSEISLEERIRLAKSTSNTNILNVLAQDEDSQVRFHVARSTNATTEILMKLATDKKREVRDAVAINENVTAEILLKLTEDKNFYVSIQEILLYLLKIL